ncbi:uncharacterized protein LOC106167829, partial [Lingula anatina]|uniref:Uncharacterized protein LOC106167829 n=1 Tax=Lingula anatina TaxID=7574 RepID=A0A1S3IW27_LINAN
RSQGSLSGPCSNAEEDSYSNIPVFGKILLSMEYDYRKGWLIIHIYLCQDLAPADVKKNRSDPYVKTYLLPDKSRGGKRKTKIKKNTLNPTFDESLHYIVTKNELGRFLWLSFWHSVTFGHNMFLAEVLLPLNKQNFADTSPQWFQLSGDHMAAGDRDQAISNVTQPHSIKTTRGQVLNQAHMGIQLQRSNSSKTSLQPNFENQEDDFQSQAAKKIVVQGQFQQNQPSLLPKCGNQRLQRGQFQSQTLPGESAGPNQLCHQEGQSQKSRLPQGPLTDHHLEEQVGVHFQTRRKSSHFFPPLPQQQDSVGAGGQDQGVTDSQTIRTMGNQVLNQADGDIHTHVSDLTLLSKKSTQENTVTTDPETDHHTNTSSVQNEVVAFFNRDKVQQREEKQYKCTKGNEGENDDHNIYRQVSVFLHRDLLRYLTSYAPGRTCIHVYPLHLQEYFLRSAQGPPFRVGEEYCYEAVRLSSFKDLPNSVPVPATRLAQSGFHYTGNSDEVVCFSCGGRLKEWTYGDNPFVRHRNFFPDCPLMNGTEVENVPLFPRDPDSNFNIGANVDPFPNLANTRSTPRDQSGNWSSLLSSQQALSRPLGITSPEVATLQFTPLESPLFPANINGNTSVPSNASHRTSNVPSRMRNESDRLTTFVNWPSGAGVLPRDLARAGFFYVGMGDRVQCAFCEGVLRNWEPGDQPMQEHRRYLSTCPFILGLEVGNIPVEEPSTALPLAVSESQRQAVGGSTTGSENATNGATLGILTARPRHEKYAIENTRVQTFANWPPSRIPCPEELARAGFFYAGFGDNVKCFFCDGGLRNWEPQDDPWTEHARWFPRCGFVRQCKGDEFIRMIKEQNSPNNQVSIYLVTSLRFTNGLGLTLYIGYTLHIDLILFYSIYPSQAQTQTQRPQGAPGSYHVEAREIKARLDTPTVQAVLDMGFSRDTVRQAIEQRLRNTGDDFPSAATLFDAVLNIEDENNRQGAAAISVIPQEEPGQQPLNATLSEAPPHKAAQKTSQTQNTDKLSKKDKKKKKQDAPVVKDSDDKETKSLIEENKRLKEERTCKICMDEEVSVVFLPCGHLVACVQCAPALRNCAICRAAIKGTVRSILS